MQKMTIAEAYKIIGDKDIEREELIQSIREKTGATRKAVVRKIGELIEYNRVFLGGLTDTEAQEEYTPDECDDGQYQEAKRLTIMEAYRQLCPTIHDRDRESLISEIMDMTGSTRKAVLKIFNRMGSWEKGEHPREAETTGFDRSDSPSKGDKRFPSRLSEIRSRIAEESKMARLHKRIAELKRDRDELLSEFNDVIKARPVPRAPEPATSSRLNTIRVSVGDIHGMRQDKAAVSAFMKDMKTLCPNEVVILGDVVDCGGFLAKHQTLGFVAECDYSYREDINAANDFLDRLQAVAPDAAIHFIMGNHDDRVEKWCVDQVMAKGRDAELLMSVYGPVAMLRLEERGIRVYRRDKIYGDGLPRGWMRLGKMFFTHDLGYSVNAARSAVLKTGGNVTFGHSHRWDVSSVVFPNVGVCAAFNPGCLCTIQPMYMHSKPTDWTQGYDIDFVCPSGNFLRQHIPIWKGKSLAGAMIERFKS